MIRLLFSAAILGLALSAHAKETKPSAKWRLSWNDEFNGLAGAAPDSKRWTYNVGHGADGWGNQELEYYCAPTTGAPCDPRHPNIRQDGRGNLVIAAVRDSSGTWTSGRMLTQGLTQFKFGRIEARMKLPAAAGLWPAFWMLGVDISSVGWPACGEIDFMENVPENVPGGLGPGKIRVTLHGKGYSGVSGVGQNYAFPRKGRVDDGFHVYGALWSEDLIEFYVDDRTKPFFRVTPASLPPETRWSANGPFFLIMNLAVGGSWPKAPDASTPNPALMFVDWVRVYEAR
ncbi:MAG: glycoside hydrolase family 16 protein [Elusimicrobiota bacterium]|jgi:beta-glucanase (GH16 family)